MAAKDNIIFFGQHFHKISDPIWEDPLIVLNKKVLLQQPSRLRM